MYYTTIEEAQEALDAAEQDIIADFGEVGLEAGWYDVVRNVASFCQPDVAREILRMELGLGIFPDDPDPLEPWEPVIKAAPRDLTAARERRNQIRSELPLAGDFGWRR